MAVSKTQVAQADMEARLVRYEDLIPCTTAFIDTRTPGSQRKENFTIIGPGVSENPEQHVHISIPHGFNIGAARQPPRCVNSQHSHNTAEVFIIHSGRWRFKTGHDGEGPSIVLNPGDTISIPTQVFRGFENIGDDEGFMFAVLGGDDPGRVTWAPYVFQSAEQYGLVLLESGRLIDTNTESVPADARRMPITSLADVARHRQLNLKELEDCVVPAQSLAAGGGLSSIAGFAECPIAGVANVAEDMPAGKLGWPHHFQLRALRVAPKARSPSAVRFEEEVLMVHEGRIGMEWPDGQLVLGAGDTLTVPQDVERSFFNPESEPAVAYIVRGGDHPKAARWSP
jgi:mannose-6-phosphate isomerase-like protein (cupin superfamily)